MRWSIIILATIISSICWAGGDRDLTTFEDSKDSGFVVVDIMVARSTTPIPEESALVPYQRPEPESLSSEDASLTAAMEAMIYRAPPEHGLVRRLKDSAISSRDAALGAIQSFQQQVSCFASINPTLSKAVVATSVAVAACAGYNYLTAGADVVTGLQAVSPLATQQLNRAIGFAACASLKHFLPGAGVARQRLQSALAGLGSGARDFQLSMDDMTKCNVAIQGPELLHCAAYKGDPLTVKAILGMCRPLAKIEGRTALQLTPLHIAVIEGHLEVADYLISRGADINARGMHGLTAVHMAANLGNYALVSALVSRGADISIKHKFGLTAADLADREGHSKIVSFLTYGMRDQVSQVEASETRTRVRPLEDSRLALEIEAEYAAINEGVRDHVSRVEASETRTRVRPLEDSRLALEFEAELAAINEGVRDHVSRVVASETRTRVRPLEDSRLALEIEAESAAINEGVRDHVSRVEASETRTRVRPLEDSRLALEIEAESAAINKGVQDHVDGVVSDFRKTLEEMNKKFESEFEAEFGVTLPAEGRAVETATAAVGASVTVAAINLPYGAECSVDTQCLSNICFAGRVCGNILGDTSTCTRDLECVSNNCRSGICAHRFR